MQEALATLYIHTSITVEKIFAFKPLINYEIWHLGSPLQPL